MITSNSNSQVKAVINLLKKSGERREKGLFVIEGIRMFREIPRDRLVNVYVSESYERENFDLIREYKYELVADNVFKQMSDTKTPQGIIGVVKMADYSLADCLKAEKNPLLVVLENLQDPGNLGTILRTAEGAGATGIIMSKDTVDIYNPKTIRSTMGALFRMPFIYSEDILSTVQALKDKGITVFAAHLQDSTNYFSADYTKPCAIMIGNEGNGLSEVLTKKADIMVKIPMQGQVESLNAAMSAGIILYEAARQRY